MEVENFPKIPETQKDLTDPEGKTLGEMESDKRAAILKNLTEVRKERDKEIKTAESFTTKLKDFFGAGIAKQAEQNVRLKNEDMHHLMHSQHFLMNESLKVESKKIIQETIQNPLSDLNSLYKKMYELNLKSDLSHEERDMKMLEFKIAEEKAKQSFSLENLRISFQDPEFRRNITWSVESFLNFNDHALYENTQRPHGYRMEGATGFPVDVSKVIIEGIANAIQTEGADSIELAPDLFRLINNAMLFYPDGLSDDVRKKLSDLILTKGMYLSFKNISDITCYLDMVSAGPEAVTLKECIDVKLDQVFLDKKWAEIEMAFRSNSEIVFQSACEKLDAYLQKFGIHLDDVKDSWDIKSIYGPTKRSDIESNLPYIEDLEEVRPGIVSSLLYTFGIKEFHRYPTDALVEQFDTQNEDKPYGVLLFTNDDHEQAFDVNKQTIQRVYEDLKNRNVGLRIAEFDSPFALMKNLASFNDMYGEKHKMLFMILGAHGSEQGFSTSFNTRVDSTDLSGSGVQRMKNFFVPGPEIVLASCSTGAENGFGQKLSDEYEAHVHAPSTPTQLKDIQTTFTEEGKPRFDVTYREDVLRKYTRGVLS